ncbi:MAG: AAA family ATPase [Synergistaceae bacterium]|jgi:hypothetical protein|nr:AAA family ATPase [Synergistaceae bacterium]
MPKIEGFHVKNFKALKDVILGRLWNRQKATPLSPLTAVIGKNGVGKSTLFDAFGFLADCLKVGVEEACDLRGRGGFGRIRSQGISEPIGFEVYYKEDGNARPITYELSIDLDDEQRPYVLKERLRQRRKGQKHGWPFSFLVLNSGKGVVWKGEAGGHQIEEGEAWFLGGIPAIKSAYPSAKDAILTAYVNDSICGTWECLANAVYKGGAVALSAKGWQAVGKEKSQWAERISPKMNVDNNMSPSFNYLRQSLHGLLASA